MVNNLDTVYSALADPTRRDMLGRLEGRSLSVSELGSPYGMTLAAVGKHVAVLESAGLVRTLKEGRVRTCTLVPHSLSTATAWLARHERYWNDRIDAIVDQLEGK